MWILLLAILVLVVVSYIAGNRDLFNPVFLCCSMFMVSAVCAATNISIWGIDLSSTTILLIVLSLLSMITFGWLGLYVPTKKVNGNLVEAGLRYIYIDNFKLFCVILLGVLSTVFYLRDVISIARRYGYALGGGIGVLIGTFRSNSHFSIDLEDKVSSLSSWTMDLFRLSAYIMTYIGVNNWIVTKKTKECVRFFAITVFFCLSILISGARMQILKISIFAVLVYFILLKKHNKWNTRIRTKSLIKILAFIVVILVAFVGLREYVGRSTSDSPLYYLTRYMGGSIQLLDLFVEKPIVDTSVWGKETFYNTINFLGRRLGNSNWRYVFAKEFRSSNGVNVGNVYTALRCFYADFGFIGTLICSAIVGFVFSFVYALIRKRKKVRLVDPLITLYCYFSYSYVLFSINYYFDFIGITFFKILVLFLIVRWYIVDFNCRIKLKLK